LPARRWLETGMGSPFEGAFLRLSQGSPEQGTVGWL